MESVFWRMKPQVIEYQTEWPSLFEEEKKLLLAAFGSEEPLKSEQKLCQLSHVEHFGSTSVPGMWAKPIIDIQAVAHPMPLSEQTLARLKEMGYVLRPTEGVDIAVYMRFDKGDPQVTHCLHLRRELGTQSTAFRDYLRCHPEDVQRYSQAKRDILEGKGDSSSSVTMKEYRQQKQAIIDDISVKVEEWLKTTTQQ